MNTLLETLDNVIEEYKIEKIYLKDFSLEFFHKIKDKLFEEDTPLLSIAISKEALLNMFPPDETFYLIEHKKKFPAYLDFKKHIVFESNNLFYSRGFVGEIFSIPIILIQNLMPNTIFFLSHNYQ